MATRPLAQGQSASLAARAHLVHEFLEQQRSEATRRAYTADLTRFFSGELQGGPVEAFLALPRHRLARRMGAYKAELLAQGMSEKTVNRCLSAVRSLLKFACERGLSNSDGRGLVESEKVKPSPTRSTLDASTLKRLLAAPGSKTLRGRRDTAILHLLGENALRRAEVCALNVSDFCESDRTLIIRGARSGESAPSVPLSRKTTAAIAGYLRAAGHAQSPNASLFRNLDHRPAVGGERLTADGISFVVREYGGMVGVDHLTPQQLRRSAIMVALENSSGPLRRVLRTFQDVEELTHAPSVESRALVDGDSSAPGRRPRPARPPASDAEGRLQRVLRLTRRGEATYFVVRKAAVGAPSPHGSAGSARSRVR